jgi:transcriptional regulator with XRE-family HTH domain
MGCEIAKRGRMRREALGLRQIDVAARMGNTQAVVCTFERRAPQKFEALRRWATALEMSFDELAFGAEAVKEAEQERAAETDVETMRSAGER